MKDGMKGKKKIKGRDKKAVAKGIQLRSIAIGIGIVLILTGIVGILYNIQNSEDWSVSDEGILSYDLPERTDYSITDINTSEDGDVLKYLTFKSEDEIIAGLMRFPSYGDKVPGIVVLPGAGVTKEGQQGLASDLADMGYATITIDQRNMGVVDPEKDLALFNEGKESVEYSMVYDALMAAEVLRDQKEVDPEKIAMLGISNGGRFAIIAAALDPKIKGVVGISTSGYGTGLIDKNRVDENTFTFYRSIDPDTYIATISPRKVIMFHAFDDTVVPYSMAKDTFELAREPKSMYTINGNSHGYDISSKEDLEKELSIILA
jgi:hypothetical protein